MIMFPVGFLVGGRLAVAVAAGLTKVPGGSDYRALYLEGASNITASPAGLSKVKLPGYAGFLASNSKGARLLAVVAAGTTSLGESDDELPSEDCQAAVSSFRLEMELFKMSQRPVALVGSPTDLLIDGAFGTAQDCETMVEFLLSKVPIHRDTLKELISVGKAFLTVKDQAKEGYVKADALANVIQGLKLVGKTFFVGVDLPEYSSPVVPLSADDIDKDSFFKEMINIFIVLYTAVYTEASKKYGFGAKK